MSALPTSGFVLRAFSPRTALILHSPALAHTPALAPAYEPHRVHGIPALLRHLRDAPPSTAVVLDPYDGADHDLSDALADVVRHHPMTPFVAALPFSTPERMADARAVLDWGVSELLDLELESPAPALALRLHAAHARPLKRRVEPRLSRHLSAGTLLLLRRAAEVAADGGSALTMALSLQIRPVTLTAWCTRQGLPRPRRLLTWSRVLLAAALAEDPTRSQAAVARACAYTSDRSLRRAVRSLLGPDSANSPRDRLFAVAVNAFNHELRELREAVRQRERARRMGRNTA